MKWLHVARLLLEIVAWIARDAAKREGAAAVRAALGERYGRIVDELVAKADAAADRVPSADEPGLRDDDGFRRD